MQTLTQLPSWLNDSPELLAGIQRGIEKESLRVDSRGVLAQTEHPRGLGSALTHDSVTTDFSESLLEFITPPSAHVSDTLVALSEIHTFAYKHLGDEQLWAASMPCIVSGDASIPVARYGSSNVGRMKTVYRLGLGNRYGRMMQAIAGVHYNFSIPDSFWETERSASSAPETSLQDYKTRRYLDLIRNFRTWSWLLIYLYGASPAVCESFLAGRSDHGLETLDTDCGTLYLPYATALRMGNLGYNSSSQNSLRICYNSLDNYLRTLTEAILEPHHAYESFRGEQDGELMQLSDGLLQIENEFYSTIRPKRSARSGEAALTALHQRGIEYVEVRCNDVNPFVPVGIDKPQVRFIDSFLMHCLLQPSPECNEAVQERQIANQSLVVSRGREPGLMLETDQGATTLQAWAQELLNGISQSAALLDEIHGSHEHQDAVALQERKLTGDEELPSARVLREIRERKISYSRLAREYSQHWAEFFRASEITAERLVQLTEESEASLARQKNLELSEEKSFKEYLESYYDQYRVLAEDLSRD
ncbi:MAG: glutamate--cysteine ligase [Pseudomonadota bacterium]